jgi:hypothetical protein
MSDPFNPSDPSKAKLQLVPNPDGGQTRVLVRSDRRRQILTPLQGSNEAADALKDFPTFAAFFPQSFPADLNDPSSVAVVRKPREADLGDALEKAFDQAQSTGAPYVFVTAGGIWELHNSAIVLEQDS